MSDPRRDERFDQELRTFLAAEAEDRRGVPSATEMAMRISAAPRAASLGRGSGLSLAWLILLGLLAIALVGAVLIGVGGKRAGLAVVPRPSAGSTTYAPAFLRLDGSELAAVRVDADGNETELLRLPGANLSGDYAYGGAVSTSGLLAVPRPAALMYHWEIFDLADPGAEPIGVPGTNQYRTMMWDSPYVGLDGSYYFDTEGGAFWGPRDQLAILTYERVLRSGLSSPDFNPYLTFVDGQTGQARRVDLLDSYVYVLPQWVPDGSGVLLADRQTDQVTGVLRQDGTIDRDVPEQTWSFCDSVEASTSEFACQSPDGSMVVRWPGTVVPTGLPSFDVRDGGWAGWLEVPS